GAEIGQFLLNCPKSQSTHNHQLADITLPGWIGEKQPQDFRAHFGKQNIQDCRRSFHLNQPSSANSTVLSSQVSCCAHCGGNDLFPQQINATTRHEQLA